ARPSARQTAQRTAGQDARQERGRTPAQRLRLRGGGDRSRLFLGRPRPARSNRVLLADRVLRRLAHRRQLMTGTRLPSPPFILSRHSWSILALKESARRTFPRRSLKASFREGEQLALFDICRLH